MNEGSLDTLELELAEVKEERLILAQYVARLEAELEEAHRLNGALAHALLDSGEEIPEALGGS